MNLSSNDYSPDYFGIDEKYKSCGIENSREKVPLFSVKVFPESALQLEDSKKNPTCCDE